MLERVRPLRVRGRADRAPRPGVCSARTRGSPRSTCRRSPARRWTASRCARPTRRGRCRRRRGSPPAGRRGGALEPGEAMAIATGGVVPEGADAVVPIEDVERGSTPSSSRAVVDRARTSAPAAAMLAQGDVVVAAGTRLGPAHVWGARGGRRGRRVRATACRGSSSSRPGRELAAPGEPLGPGEIYDANGFILAAQVRSAGAEVERLPPRRGRRRGDPGRDRARRSRPTCSSRPAASRSACYDLVRAAEAELGVEEVFWRVAMRPGKPIAFGVRGRTLVFGLPGNPVSSLVGFELFVRPALLALQGARRPGARVPARPARPRRCAATGPRRARCAPARASRTETSCSSRSRGQESHMIAAGRDRRRARARSTWRRRARGRQRRSATCAL